MGAYTDNDVAAALSLTFGRALTPQFTHHLPLLSTLPRVSSTEKSVNFTVQFKNGVADAAPADPNVRRSTSDAKEYQFKDVAVPWAYFDDVVSINGRAAAIARGRTSVVASLGSLHKKALSESVGRLGGGIGAKVFSGTGDASGTPDLYGLVHIVDATNTYILDPSTYTTWKSTEQTGSLSSLSFEMLRDLCGAVYTASKEEVDLICTTRALFDDIIGLYGSNTVPYIREINTANGKRKLQEGVRAIEINGGIPVIYDPNCTANTIYALNTKFWELHQLDYAPESMAEPDQIAANMRSLMADPTYEVAPELVLALGNAIRNAPGLVPGFKKLGATGNSDEYVSYADVQVLCRRRDVNGKLTLS